MSDQQWIDLAMAALLSALLYFGLASGTMPGNNVIHPDRDEQPLGFWLMAGCFGILIFIALGAAAKIW